MVSLSAHNLSVVYQLPRKFSLSGQLTPATPAGGQLNNRFVTALNGVGFSLNSGDRLGLVGANGSGKTTLLRTLFGILEPTSGHINLEGKVDALFNINLGFRREASGRRNIILRGLINGLSRKEIERQMDAIIEFSELGEFIDLPLKSYSQGMSARLAFSIATSLEPQILLMDEWIGAGDTDFQQKARNRMSELAEAAGIVVLASHNQNLIRRTCNKILSLQKGELSFFGPTDDYFSQLESAKSS